MQRIRDLISRVCEGIKSLWKTFSTNFMYEWATKRSIILTELVVFFVMAIMAILMCVTTPLYILWCLIFLVCTIINLYLTWKQYPLW